MGGWGWRIKSSVAPLEQGMKGEEARNSSLQRLFLSFVGATLLSSSCVIMKLIWWI